MREIIRRHISLIRWDLAEHRKSSVGEAKAALLVEDDELVDLVSGEFSVEETRPPNGYLDVIRKACTISDVGLDSSEAERLWRAASGAAHGMHWPMIDLTKSQAVPHSIGEVLVPDTDVMLAVLEAAASVTRYSVLQYLALAGIDIQQALDEARDWLAENITLKPGVGEDRREQLKSRSAVGVTDSQRASEGRNEGAL